MASLAAVRALNQRAPPVAVPDDEGASDLRFGFRLEESAKRRGVDFVHEGPTFDSRLDHIMPQVASMGAAVAVADFDRDGWQDFYVTNSREGSLNRLYRNQGDGTFEDVAPSVGLADVNRRETGVSMGAVWGDYDNDGWEDLFLYRYGQPQLFRNDGGRRFVAVGTGLPRWVNANAATWLDYDRDGRLDLFLAGYWPDGVDLWKLETTRIMPESFEYANNGGRKYLLRNRGDGAFEDVTAAARHQQPAVDARRDCRRSVRHGLSRSLPCERLRCLRAVRQSGRKAVRRRRGRDRRRARAEERDECVDRRRVQRRPALDLQDEHLRAGPAGAGQRSLGAQAGGSGRPEFENMATAMGVDLAAGVGERSSAI